MFAPNIWISSHTPIWLQVIARSMHLAPLETADPLIEFGAKICPHNYSFPSASRPSSPENQAFPVKPTAPPPSTLVFSVVSYSSVYSPLKRFCSFCLMGILFQRFSNYFTNLQVTLLSKVPLCPEFGSANVITNRKRGFLIVSLDSYRERTFLQGSYKITLTSMLPERPTSLTCFIFSK